jgi:phosphotransacetylase
MSLLGFEQLHESADGLAEPVPVAAAGAADQTVLEALRTACERGWIVPLAVGRHSDMRRVADQSGIDLGGFTLIDSEHAAATAVGEVRAGRARLLMKGQVSTPDLMRAVLDPQTGLRTGRTICQVVLMEILPARRRFLLADTGISIEPSLDQKVDILQSAARVARALGADEPRVACMAATEKAVESMPETIDAAELQRRNEAGDFPDCVVNGPLSFDLAYQTGAADKKGVKGSVAGSADVMLFPNLVSANLTVKAIMYTADCRFGGILCGTASPVVFMSRADTTPTRLNSLALALKFLSAAVARS